MEKDLDQAPDVLRGEMIPDYVRKYSSTKEWPNGIRGEKGFYPYVPEKMQIDFYKRLLKHIDLSKINIEENKVLGLMLPVYPLSFNKKEVEYKYKNGEFSLHMKNSGFILRKEEMLVDHYIPLPKDKEGPYFTDFAEPLFKFLAVKSNVDWVPENSVFYFRNDVTFNRIVDMSFQYEALEFSIISRDSILFSKEI